jgi:hypothetical protein
MNKKKKIKKLQKEVNRLKDKINPTDCPNCIEGLVVKIKGKFFCEDCHIEL